MSIAKPFTFTANTYAKASEVNANFDTVYSQVNTNISEIAQNATDIDNLENNKADVNGSTSQRFAVADAISNGDAINKQTLFKAIGNSLDYISGLVITKDSGSPNDTIIVSEGSCYDSTKTVVLSLGNSLSKQNLNQAASATYYVYIIGNSTGSLIDILISTSSTTPTLPAGYSLFRQIGNYTTDSNNKINSISYFGQDANSDKSIGNIIHAMMPDYTAGILLTMGSDNTIPSDGVIVVQTAVNGEYYRYLYINGVTVNNYGPSANINLGAEYLVKKGDVVKLTGGTTLYFYPCGGVQ